MQFSCDLNLNNYLFVNCLVDLTGSICIRFGSSWYINNLTISACVANGLENAIYMFNESELFLNGDVLINTNIYRNPFEAGFNAGKVTLPLGFNFLSAPLIID